MRILFIAFFLILLQITAAAQKISYTIPGGLENKISQEAYKTLVDTSVAIISKRYRIEYVDDGFIQLKSGQDFQGFTLNPLIIEYVKTADKTQWHRTIHDYFDKAFFSVNKPKKDSARQHAY